MVDQIPLLAESAAKAISNIKFDKVVVWEGGNASGPNGTAGFIQMAKSMPPMTDVLRTVAGVELPAFFGTMAQDAPWPRGMEWLNFRPCQQAPTPR